MRRIDKVALEIVGSGARRRGGMMDGGDGRDKGKGEGKGEGGGMW